MNDEVVMFETVTEKLLSETALIRWHELQKFFAQGAVLQIDEDLDLVETASLFADDKVDVLEPLLQALKVRQPTNEQARSWYDQDSELWSVVVAPYVLVQDTGEKVN